MHRELSLLFEQDRADRKELADFPSEPPQRLLLRAQARRERVETLLAREPLLDADDYFSAAMIFQHGDTLEHFLRAHHLAYQGVKLGHAGCLRLMATAYDRWLMAQGYPQKYGTQYIIEQGQWVLFNVDPCTTDEQRSRWNIPPLSHCLQRAEEMNRTIFSVLA